jgi:hypothetical protein
VTKSVKFDASNIVTAAPAPAPATLEAAARPYAVNIFGPTTHVLQQVSVLCRQGYIVDANSTVEIFAAAGTMSLVMVLGDAEQTYVAAAAVSVGDAAALQEAKYRRDVEQAAARQIKEAAEAELAAKKAALLAEQKRQLAELESEIAAASK